MHLPVSFRLGTVLPNEPIQRKLLLSVSLAGGVRVVFERFCVCPPRPYRPGGFFVFSNPDDVHHDPDIAKIFAGISIRSMVCRIVDYQAYLCR